MNLLKTRNTLRVAMLAGALVFSLSGGTAFAQIDITGGNDTTGYNSRNNNDWDIDNNIDVEIENEARVDNNTDIEVNTGDNWIECNTQVDNVSTGDINGDITVENEFNNGNIEFMGDMAMGDISLDFSNELTGPSSENANEVDIDNEIDINIDNETNIDNRLDLDLNTGDNRIEHNTVVGDVTTGDIDFTVETMNNANENGGNLDLSDFNGINVSGEFSNELTGPCSENENTLDVNNDLNIDVQNDTNIDNNIDINANTGHNLVGGNTVVGDISTGSVDLNISTTNTAN